MVATPHRRFDHLFPQLRALMLAALLLPVTASAQATRTWTGGGADNNWTTAANWGGTAPVAGDNLVFDATGVGARPSPTNNFTAGTSFGSITIAAAGYTIGGNAVSLSTGLTASIGSGMSTIALAVAGTGSVTNSASGQLWLSGANTFTGGLSILAGSVIVTSSASAVGAGVITLGNSSGAAAASLLVGSALTITRPIVLAAGTTGTLTLGNNGSVSVTFTGGVTGTNNLRINSGFTTTYTVAFTTTPVNNSGTVTSQGTGSVTVSSIGSNVTEVNGNNVNGALLVASVAVNPAGTTLIASGGVLEVDNVTGTGNLVLRNNHPTCDNCLDIKTSINNAGTVTNSGTGRQTVIRGVIGTNVTGLIQNSSSSNLDLISSTGNTFTSNVEVKAGILYGAYHANAFGTGGTITLGNTNGSANAALIFETTGANISRPIVLASGTTGTLTIGTKNASVATTFSGGITGANNLTIAAAGTGSSVTLATASVNIAGTITNASTTAANTTISAPIGANVTGIVQNSTTSALTITGALTVNAAGTTLTNAAGTKALTLSGGVGGSGSLVLRNNSATADGIVMSTTSVNHTGPITNSGSGSGSVLISATVGANVTRIAQNSTTSDLTVSGALTVNTSSTTLTNTAGTKVLRLSGGVTGTGDLVLENNSATALAVDINSGPAVNNVGEVRNVGTGTGTARIMAVVGSNVSRVIQNSATSALILVGNNTFAGGLLIKAGNVIPFGNNTAVGAGTITLGDASGSASAGLLIGGNGMNISRPVVLQSGSTGALSIGTIAWEGMDVSGTFSGGVTGGNNLTIASNGLTGSVTISGALNNAGTISHTGSAARATQVTGGIGANVTGIVHDATGGLTIHTTAISVHSTGTTITNNSPASAIQVNGGLTGTGDLRLLANTDVGITISSGVVNIVGSVINAGSGTGRTSIDAVLGSGVTALIQNSVTAPMHLLAGQTFTTGLIVRAGTVVGAGSTAAVFGAGSVTLGEPGGSASASLLVATNGLTIEQPIVLAGGAGTLALGSYGNVAAVTFSGGVTGTGNLTIVNDGGSATVGLSGTINNAGAVRNTGTSSGATTISGAVGSNVTSIIQGSMTSALTVSGPVTVNSSGTTFTNSNTANGSKLVVSGAISGSGDIILANAGATSQGVTISGAVNNAGTVTHSSTGAGGVLVSGPVGASVTNISHASSQSDLTISGAITVNATATTVTHMTTQRNVTLSGGTTGTGNMVLSLASHGSGFIYVTTTALNHVGTVTSRSEGVASVSNASTHISAAIGANVTGFVQDGTLPTYMNNANSAFAGTVRVLRGNLIAQPGSGFGSDTLRLGNTGGTAPAGILAHGGTTIANPILLQSGSTGMLSIGTPYGASGTTTFSGGVTGLNGLRVSNETGTAKLIVTTGAINMAGKLSIYSNSDSLTSVSAPIGSNVDTIFVVNSGRAIELTSQITVNNAGTLLLNNHQGARFSFGGSVTGIGDFRINSIPNSGGTTLTGLLNNVGRIINMGPGFYPVTLSGSVGPNVTGIEQNASAELVLAGANTSFAGPVTVNSGTLTAGSTGALGNGSNTNALVLAGGVFKASGSFTSPATRPVSIAGNASVATGTFDVTLAGGVSGAGSLTKTGAGTLALGAASSVGGSVNITEGILQAPAAVLSIGGNWFNNGTFVHSGGTVVLNGTSRQEVQGSTAMSFNSLTIDNPAGVSISTLLSVGGTLAFSAGKLATNSRIMLAPAAVVTGAGPGKYVHGTVERSVAAVTAPVLEFAVGDASTYAPVSVAFAGTTSGSGSVWASTTSGDHPGLASSGLNGSKTVNRYWTLTNHGVSGFSSYDATFTFDSTDLDAGANTSNFVVRKYDGSTWSNPAIGTRTGTSAQATGLTAFSDFVLGQMPAIVATVASTTPASLTQATLHGATIDVDLTDGTYAASLSAAEFELAYAPAGTAISMVTRTSATRATLTLTYDGTDFDSDTSLAVRVLTSALATGEGPSTTSGVSIAGVLETVLAMRPVSITERTLDGATLVIELTEGTWAANLSTSHFLLPAAPAGASIASVTRDSDTVATLHLAFAETDFDTDAMLSVQALQAALASGTGPVTASTTVVAVLEIAVVIHAAAPSLLAEESLAGATVSVDLTDGTYAATLSPAAFSLVGAPTGTTIAAVDRASATSATITLAFDGTDFDAAQVLGVQVMQAALATGTGPATSVSLPISPAVAASATVTGPSSGIPNALSTAFTLTSAEANGTPMTVAIDRTFTLSSSATSGSFWANPPGVSALTQVTIPAGSSTASFLYKDAGAGSRTITATSDALGSAALAHTVAATALAIAPDAPLLESNLEAAVLTADLTAGTYAVSVDPTAFIITGPAGVSIASVTRSSETRVQLVLAFDGTDFDSTSTLTVGVTDAALATGVAATAAGATVTPSPVSALRMTGPASTVQLAMSSAISLAAHEANGTPMSSPTDAVVTLTSSSSGAKAFYGSPTGTPITTLSIPAGSTTASLYYRDDAPGRHTLTATSTLGTSTLSLEVLRQLALAFVTVPDSLPADLPAGQVQVRAVDARGEIDTTFTETITLSLASKPDGATLAGSLVATPVKGVATFTGVQVDLAGAGYAFGASSTSLPQVTSSAFKAYLTRVALAPTIVVSKAAPAVGETVTITVSVANNSQARAMNVRYKVPLPVRAQLMTSTASSGAYDPATGVWTVGTIAGKGSATLTLTLVVKAGTQ